MSRVGISSNIQYPSAKCMKCKYWKAAGKSGRFPTAGRCQTGYCKKNFIKSGRRDKRWKTLSSQTVEL